MLRSFFTDRQTGRPLRDGVFLEIGGVDGLIESNSWIFEACLGWTGILVEGHPTFFRQLTRHRPATLNLNMAACASAGVVNYTARPWTGAAVSDTASGATPEGRTLEQLNGATVPVACAPLGATLSTLGVHEIDFMSVDVEGAEVCVCVPHTFVLLMTCDAHAISHAHTRAAAAAIFAHMSLSCAPLSCR